MWCAVVDVARPPYVELRPGLMSQSDLGEEFGVYGAAAVLRRRVLHCGGSLGVVRWAPLLTSANVHLELGDQRSFLRDVKMTTTRWRSHGDYLACSGLWQPVLHGIG